MKRITDVTNIKNRMKQLRRNVKNAARNPDKVVPETIEYFNFFKDYMQTISLTNQTTTELYENIMWYQKKMN